MARNCACYTHGVAKCPTHTEAECREPRAPKDLGWSPNVVPTTNQYRRCSHALGSVVLYGASPSDFFHTPVTLWQVPEPFKAEHLGFNEISLDAPREEFLARLQEVMG